MPLMIAVSYDKSTFSNNIRHLTIVIQEPFRSNKFEVGSHPSQKLPVRKDER